MPFEDVMSAVSRLLLATDTLAALGAELSLIQANQPGDPRMVAALQAVSAAAGFPDLSELPGPQRELIIGLVRMSLRQAADLVDDPGRAPGWAYTDPAILYGWGRGSAMVPAVLAAAPELADVRSFLDIGTGVGLLAVAAARTWPQATVVGIDTWAPSREAAVANVRAADLEGRITIRDQDLAAVDDVEAYDCIWFPTFFFTQDAFEAAVPRLQRALRPGGWLVLGRMAPPPDPVARATSTMRIVRSGGTDFDAKDLMAALEAAGCDAVRVLPRTGPAPMEFVVGQRATA